MYEDINRIDNIIAGLSSQQKVISNNVANAHTPGYVRQTYDFKEVLGQMDNPYENDLSRKMGSMKGTVFSETDGGQKVNLADEMINMQKVYLNYAMVTRRASSIFNNLRKAVQIGK